MYRTGVSALIVNSHNELLLVNLESFEEKYFAIPGGGLDEGETLENAVYREVEEELAITKENLELVGKSDIPLRFLFKQIVLARDGREYVGQERHFFGFRFTGNDSMITARAGEVRSYIWVPMPSLGDYLLFDNQLHDTVEKIAEIFPQLVEKLQ
jgi:putative (di)nucleoside polyphosphate hydrolase